MSKFIQILTPIKNMDGSLAINADKEKSAVTVKDIVMQYLMDFTTDSGDYKEIMRTRKTSEKIYNHEIDKLELEDAEFDLLEKALKKGIGQAKFHHPDIVLCQVYDVIEQTKEEDRKEDNAKDINKT